MFNVIDTDSNKTIYSVANYSEALMLRDGANNGVDGARKYLRYVVGRA